MIDRLTLYGLLTIALVSTAAAVYGLVTLVLGDSWGRPLVSLLVGGCLAAGSTFGAWTVNGQLEHSPLPNAGVERAVLTRRQRKRLNKARSDALYDRAIADVREEQDRMITRQLEGPPS